MIPFPTNTPCPLCGARTFTPFLARHGYALVHCVQCFALHVNPMPSDAALQAHYQDPTYYAGQANQGYHNYAAMQKALLPHFRRRLQHINQQFPERGRLLDFGCAAGYFLELAKADGWQIAGVELAQDMAQQAAQSLGIAIANSLDALTESFDVITLWEVVEHLPRPNEQLQALRDRLRPNGLLMLSTPNNGHWQAIREPDQWEAYRPPSHLLYFTAHTLTDALQRSGFVHVSVHRVSPLPPLPAWLRHISAPLQKSLTSGQAKAWQLALLTWRAIRILGWGWQKIAHPHDDIFTTLEAIAFRPQ